MISFPSLNFLSSVSGYRQFQYNLTTGIQVMLTENNWSTVCAGARGKSLVSKKLS
jgi:hypothetical protein